MWQTQGYGKYELSSIYICCTFCFFATYNIWVLQKYLHICDNYFVLGEERGLPERNNLIQKIIYDFY